MACSLKDSSRHEPSSLVILSWSRSVDFRTTGCAFTGQHSFPSPWFLQGKNTTSHPEMPAHKYRPLKELASNTSTETLEDCPVPYSDAELMGLKGTPKSKAKSTSYTLILLLLLSLACNVALLAKLHHEQSLRESSSSFGKIREAVCRAQELTCSITVGLERNFNMEITHDDRKIDDPVWDSPEYDAYLGWVAIDSKSAKQKGMPTSMHWPWDDHKSIYLLHGFHSLHCVVSFLAQAEMQCPLVLTMDFISTYCEKPLPNIATG